MKKSSTLEKFKSVVAVSSTFPHFQPPAVSIIAKKMTTLKMTKPQPVSPCTMITKPYECEDIAETEAETSDQSEDPLSSAPESSCLSDWDAGVEITPIESSLRQMRVSIPETTAAIAERSEYLKQPPVNTSRRSCLKTQQGSKRRTGIHYTRETMLRLPMRETLLRKRMCVSFNPAVVVRSIRPMRMMTREKGSLWFQPAEYSRMAKRCNRIARNVRHGGEEQNGRSLCSRGLEHLVYANSRKDAKFDGWFSVFKEQRTQRRGEHYDEDRMRIIYHLSTSESSMEAQIRGMADEQDIQKYLLSTRNSSLEKPSIS
ncbi:unnamed protein product [Cylindrotheca closterium]|uniref:Uncharacterized protein n=1 Tax=Cylindrotheca closterium TaxID=2856 RepID=A0AAD2G0M2_9STRA|nr:unnamed protein product [Cylindrotheca closterium]